MGPSSYMRSVVDRNVVMQRIPGTNVFNPLPCRRVMEVTPVCDLRPVWPTTLCLGLGSFNLLTPNVYYSGRTAPLTSKVAFYIFIQQI